jgi:hypothetical protein
MRGTTARPRAADPTIYAEEERVGEDILQRWIVELLRPLLQRWLTSRGVQAFVGADHARVAPDLYVLPGVDPRTRVRTWKLWQDRVRPSVAFEVVSQDWEKDYIEVIERYGALGVPEVLLFDPGWDEHAGGVRWQIFRRVGKRGLVRVEATQRDRVRSKALGCWLRAVGEGRDLRVRLATGARGDELVPTAEEAERAAREKERAAREQERAAREQERAAKEQERAAKELERTAKEAALARVRELEAELRRLTRRPRRR